MTGPELTQFLGWCSVINLALLLLSAFCLLLFTSRIAKLHAALFRLDAAGLPVTYFRYLAFYKVLTIVFNIVPYLALKIMA